MSTRVRAFHGCPGAPEDFDSVREKVPGAEWVALPREGYPGALSSPERKRPADLAIGYSWGSFDCLEFASDPSNEVRAVLLIAPYLYPTRATGPLKKTLLSLPGVGDAILRRAAPKAIGDLLEKTAHPFAVPDRYRQDAQRYLDPAMLKAALTEQSGKSGRLALALAKLRERRVPVAVLWGEGDQTSEESAQISRLRKELDEVTLERIPSAGHALLWTHPERVAGGIAVILSSFAP